MRKNGSILSRKPHVFFMTPGLFFYTVFMILPIVFTIVISFTAWNGVNANTLYFEGIDNYKQLFTNPKDFSIYSNAFGNNLKFIAVKELLVIPFRVLIAYLFYRKIRGHKFFQVAFFLPYVFSVVIIAFFSTLLFNTNFGLVNNFLAMLGFNKMTLPAWFADRSYAFPLMMIMDVWYSASIGVMIILANMKGIPENIMEASTIDGANEWTRFWRIILPDLGPSMTNLIVLEIIWGTTAFDLPYALLGPYGGTGGVLDFVNMFFYRTAFGSGSLSNTALDYGFASTISAVTFLFMFVMTGFLRKVLSRVKVWNE